MKPVSIGKFLIAGKKFGEHHGTKTVYPFIDLKDNVNKYGGYGYIMLLRKKRTVYYDLKQKIAYLL